MLGLIAIVTVCTIRSVSLIPPLKKFFTEGDRTFSHIDPLIGGISAIKPTKNYCLWVSLSEKFFCKGVLAIHTQ